MYDERELRALQERAKKRIAFETQIDRIACKLEYERSINIQMDVTRWERTVQDIKDELQANRQAEAEQGQDIGCWLQRDEALKDELNAAQENVGEAVTAARKEVASVQNELESSREQIASIKAGIESRRSKRLSILRQCKAEARRRRSSSTPFNSID